MAEANKDLYLAQKGITLKRIPPKNIFLEAFYDLVEEERGVRPTDFNHYKEIIK